MFLHLGASKFVMWVIQDGYRLPFRTFQLSTTPKIRRLGSYFRVLAFILITGLTQWEIMSISDL